MTYVIKYRENLPLKSIYKKVSPDISFTKWAGWVKSFIKRFKDVPNLHLYLYPYNDCGTYIRYDDKCAQGPEYLELKLQPLEGRI